MLADLLPPFPVLLLLGAVSTVFAAIFNYIQTNNRLKKLGVRARRRDDHNPLFLGADVIWNALQSGKVNKTIENWNEGFKTNPMGTAEFTILGYFRVIGTMDPENIKAILATQFTDFGKGERFHHQWKEFLGDSIFATDGQMWHNSRQLIRPQFLKERIADLHTFERHIQEMFKYLPMDGSPVDIADFFYRYTLDNATDFLLGHSVGSLHNPKARFAHAFQYVQRFQNNVARSGPFWRLFNRKKYNEEIQVLNDFVNPFVEKTLQMRPEDLKPKTDTDYNFLHALAEFTTDRTVLRDQLVAVLLAARDTTAATLSWLFHEISQRPDVVKRIRAEILATVGPTEMPTYAQLKDLKYLMHVINETLRLYPAVPFNVRTALKDTTLPRGGGDNGLEPIAVLKGTDVAYSTLCMQRRADLFGPDVNEFKPERWETWTPKSWQFIPFNGGPRICIGQQFAYTEIQYTLVRLFQRIEAVDEKMEGRKQELKTEVVITPAYPVMVALHQAKAQ